MYWKTKSMKRDNCLWENISPKGLFIAFCIQSFARQVWGSDAANQSEKVKLESLLFFAFYLVLEWFWHPPPLTLSEKARMTCFISLSTGWGWSSATNHIWCEHSRHSAFARLVLRQQRGAGSCGEVPQRVLHHLRLRQPPAPDRRLPRKCPLLSQRCSQPHHRVQAAFSWRLLFCKQKWLKNQGQRWSRQRCVCVRRRKARYMGPSPKLHPRSMTSVAKIQMTQTKAAIFENKFAAST